MNCEASFALASVMISALVILYYLRLNKVSNTQSRMFLALVIDNAVTSLSSFGKWAIEHYLNRQPVWALSLMSYIYFVTHLAMMVFIFMYLLSGVKQWREISGWVKAMIVIPGLIELVLILSNPAHHLIYHYTEDGVYQRSPGLISSYIVFGYYFLITIFLLIYYSKSFSVRKRTVIACILATGLLSVIVQLFFPEIKVEVLAISLCELALFYFIQNPSERIDPVLGVLSRTAFLEQMRANFVIRRRCDIVEVLLADYKEYERSNNAKQSEDLLKQVTAFLRSLSDTANIYHIEEDSFVLEIICPFPKEVGDIMRAITKRFEEGTWAVPEGEIALNSRLLRVKMPDEIRDEETLFGVMNRFEQSTYEPRAMRTEDFDLAEIERTRKITVALARAMEKKNFEMRYTPIHSVALGRVIGAEATLRFYDEELGYVYDEEIFNYADRSGHTLQLGELVIERTCRFISEQNLKEQGVSFVGVRLLPAMCLQYGLLEKIIGIVEKYMIDPKILYLQLSEYTVSKANAVFRENMRRMEEAGIRLCLEDYGSGFTNITSIYELPFKVMKINRSVIREALSNEKARITMECTLELARELSMMTMIEGIDSEEYFRMVEHMACDFAKGNYLFEQLDADDFLKVVRISAGRAGEGEVL